MEQETLYTAAKWQILKLLSNSSKSPIELAELSNTSTSNISQSLRFLELAGIVKSERISNRDKGQPRVMYTLSGNKAYLIITSNNFVEKKQITLNEYKQIILKIWLYENEQLQPFLEQATNNINSQLQNIKGIFLDEESQAETKILIIPKENQKLELKDFVAEHQGMMRKIKYETKTEQQILSKSNLYGLHNPHQLKGEDAIK